MATDPEAICGAVNCDCSCSLPPHGPTTPHLCTNPMGSDRLGPPCGGSWCWNPTTPAGFDVHAWPGSGLPD